MVNQINDPADRRQKDYSEINFYALDDFTEEPPEIVIKDGTTSAFRIAQVMKYNEFLVTEVRRREHIVRTFRWLEWFSFILEMTLVVVDLSIGCFGIFKTDYLSMTAQICVAVTTVGTCLRTLTKNFMNKFNKHVSLLVLAEGKLSIVKDKYNLFIADGQISEEEYQQLVFDFNKYEELRTQILLGRRVV